MTNATAMRKLMESVNVTESTNNVLTVDDGGRTWNVRLVSKGEQYGLDNKLSHDKDEAMVEFYDGSEDPEKFGEMGQFVSRYYARTLLGHDAWSSGPERGRGLNLQGNVPEWRIGGQTMDTIKDWIAGQIGADDWENTPQDKLDVPVGENDEFMIDPEFGDEIGGESGGCPDCGDPEYHGTTCHECGYVSHDMRETTLRDDFSSHMNEDSQEVIFYNSGFGEKPDPSKKQTVNGTLKMGDRGPIFVTDDGVQATWNQDYGWVADMD